GRGRADHYRLLQAPLRRHRPPLRSRPAVSEASARFGADGVDPRTSSRCPPPLNLSQPPRCQSSTPTELRRRRARGIASTVALGRRAVNWSQRQTLGQSKLSYEAVGRSLVG